MDTVGIESTGHVEVGGKRHGLPGKFVVFPLAVTTFASHGSWELKLPVALEIRFCLTC